MLYLDYAATTRPSEKVIAAVARTMREYPGNPSSLHVEGVRAKKRYNQAKRHIGALLGANREEILFTASGTEAINFVIKGTHGKRPAKTILVSTIEHSAAKQTAEHLEQKAAAIVRIPCDAEGYLDLAALAKALEQNDVALFSLIHANNEIGTIQDAKRIADICHQHGVKLHLDMVQAPLHETIDLHEIGCDYASFSAHKFFGPRGVGFLYAKTTDDLEPLIHGGKQEDRLRAGTENLPGIVGAEAALEDAVKNVRKREERIAALAEHFLACLSETSLSWRLNGPPLDKPRLKNILNIGFKNEDAEQIAFQLDQAGIGVSQGSACSTGVVDVSHVLKAIGVDEDYIKGSLRISLSHNETFADMKQAATTLEGIIGEN